MLSRYEIVTENDRKNATHEIMQEVALAGLYRAGFFDKAAFYGGTCLRVFHKLQRFSEDLDFSLLEPNPNFNLEDYFPAIIEEFNLLGREITIQRKPKNTQTNIESAFLKEDSATYHLAFNSEKQIKIKIEVDLNPPLHFSTEQKLLLLPYSFMTKCFTLPDLFAGKMHALAFRNWKSRVKGRDWYDFEYYVRNRIKLNFNHLQARIKQINGVEMGKEEYFELLKNKISSTDISSVKKDVLPFLKNPSELEIWSNDYFLQLVDLMNN